MTVKNILTHNEPAVKLGIFVIKTTDNTTEAAATLHKNKESSEKKKFQKRIEMTLASIYLSLLRAR